MIYGAVKPHAFLLQVLFQCCPGSSLSAIHKTDILLTVMQYDAVGLRCTLVQLVKYAWSQHTGDEVGREAELLQPIVFHIAIGITFHILVCIVTLCLLGIAVRAASLDITHHMPLALVFLFGRSQRLELGSWHQSELHVAVSLNVLFV